MGSIPGQGTKILHATQCGQEIKKIKILHSGYKAECQGLKEGLDPKKLKIYQTNRQNRNNIVNIIFFHLTIQMEPLEGLKYPQKSKKELGKLSESSDKWLDA